MHAAAVPVSSLQLNVEPALLELKEKLAVVRLVGFGGEAVTVATGAATSIVQVKEAGAARLPAGSVAVTVKA